MSWSCGIVGLPNAGKSTLFKALTAHEVTIAGYPFSTVDPNKAIVTLEDQRLINLAEQLKSEVITPATIEIIDVAGLVRGASKGEGLGNQFLGHLRNVDLLIHVVAAYDQNEINDNGPLVRKETINLELSLADLEVISRRKDKVEPKLKSGDQKARLELDLLRRLEDHLNQGLPLTIFPFASEEMYYVEQLSLLTLKKMIYIYNHDENYNGFEYKKYFPEGETALAFCGRLEAELVDLPPAEREAYLKAYGFETSKVKSLLEKCFELLGLITFYTVKGSEARAWIAPADICALSAAGKIHTDMERGFINVEVIPWDLFLKNSSLAEIRNRGLSRIEGKDYPVKDGEVLFFRFRS
jgi:ribosome-binding ATPase